MINNLDKIMKEQGLNDRQLAALTGGAVGHVWSLRQANNNPKLYMAYKIAQALNVPVTDIWVDDDVIPETRRERAKNNRGAPPVKGWQGAELSERYNPAGLEEGSGDSLEHILEEEGLEIPNY